MDLPSVASEAFEAQLKTPKNQRIRPLKRCHFFHGSVENGGLEDDNLVSKGTIFHFHDYAGRKGSLPTTIFNGTCVSFRDFF